MRAFNDGRFLDTNIKLLDVVEEMTWGFTLGQIKTSSTMRLTADGFGGIALPQLLSSTVYQPIYLNPGRNAIRSVLVNLEAGSSNDRFNLGQKIALQSESVSRLWNARPDALEQVGNLTQCDVGSESAWVRRFPDLWTDCS